MGVVDVDHEVDPQIKLQFFAHKVLCDHLWRQKLLKRSEKFIFRSLVKGKRKLVQELACVRVAALFSLSLVLKFVLNS